MLAKQFKKAYLHSLTSHFRSFYDDVSEYGSPDAANCIYFIHGIDGAPGQARFALPAAIRLFRSDLYLKSCHTANFSSYHPIWEKYTIDRVEERVGVIAADLTRLAARHGKVSVFASSNGFYDFHAAVARLDQKTRDALTLFWVACAPDTFDDSGWERVFFKLNGFVHEGHNWTAIPNNNYLRWLNPEVPYRHACRAHRPKKFFYKQDIESRFFLYGSLWSYFSISRFNECLNYLKNQNREKLTIPTYVLAAEFDGYWQGRTWEGMQELIRGYIENPVFLLRPASHLWVASPPHVYALMRLVFGEDGKRLAA